MIPTVGFNMRKITKGNVTIKVRAGAAENPLCLGGQPRPQGRASQGRAEWHHPVAEDTLLSWEKGAEDRKGRGVGERETRREKKR